MRKPTVVFGEWAEIGKDIGMEESHAIPVDEMISFVANMFISFNLYAC